MCGGAAIKKDLYVIEKVDTDERQSTKTTLMNMKTMRCDCVPTFLHDEAYIDVKACLERHRTIFPQSQSLTARESWTRSDSTPSMDEVLNTLSMHAGCEVQFLTS